MSSGPIELTDETGVRFKGRASPAPGGGSMPVQAFYSGNAVTITDGSLANLTWDTLLNGTDLLDRTDPANPLFLAAGTYAINVLVGVSGLTAGGLYTADLVVSQQSLAAGQISAIGFNLGLCAVVVVAQGDLADPLIAEAFNGDGSASRDFTLETAIIVKLA